MRALTATLVIGLFAPPVVAMGIDRAGLRAELLYGHGTSDGRPMETSIELEPFLAIRLGRVARLELSSRLRWDGRGYLAPGGPDTDTYSRASKPWVIDDSTTVEIRDAYLELALEQGLLRFGKQQIVWGALDGLKILDSVNPQSFRTFILDDFGDSRIGLWSAYADLSLGNWRAELAWIPDATGHEIPPEGAWFELTAPRFRYGAAPGTPRPLTVTRRPGFGWRDSAAGLRLSRSLGRWDLGLVALSGMDPEPLGRIRESPDGPVLERYYERRELYGLSTATAFGRIAVRAELALRPGRQFNRRGEASLSAVALDQLSAGVGIDVAGPLDTFINVQYVVDHVRAAPDGLVRPATDRLLTLALRRGFAYETVTTELRWYGDIDEGDGLLRAAVSWAIAEDTTLRLGADLFHGDPEGLFGQFEDRDRITISLEHYF